ncbi:MAG: hypothetical protein AB1558_08600, partial [Thermodesulfobacteriota bacterium]
PPPVTAAESATPAEEKDGHPATGMPVDETFSVAVRSIRHKVLPEGKEVLLIEFDRFYVPAVYKIEGGAPRIILDVTRTSSMKQEWSDVSTEGTLVKKVRVHRNRAAEILRIVLDMWPGRDYDIRPALYPGTDSSLYAMEMTGAAPKQ